MSLVVLPRQYLADANGTPRVGAKLYVYNAGTTVPRVPYTTQAYNIPHSNPVLSVSNGQFPAIYVKPDEGDYKLVITDEEDVPLSTDDFLPVRDRDFDQAAVGETLYPQTTDEINTSITPINFAYPELDARRYGLASSATATTNATALTNAIAVALGKTRGGQVLIPEGRFTTNALTITMTGNRLNQSLRISGASVNGTTLVQNGTPTALITVQSTDPATTISEVQVTIENVSLEGVGKTAHGITLNAVAEFILSRVLLSGFDRAVNCFSSLVGVVRDCMLFDSNYGFMARRNAGPNCNAVTIDRTQIKYNSSTGVDFDEGSLLRLVGCDIERNGTSGNIATGGVIIRGNVDAEVSFGAAMIPIEGCWFEANLGRTLQVVSPQTASLYLAIRDTKIMSAESGRAIVIAAARKVILDNVISPSPGDTWDITCTEGTLINCTVNVLTETGITVPYYINTHTGSVDLDNGRKDSFTATLTGVSGTVTGTIVVYQQGREVRLIWPDILGVSNTTAATITGIPTKYRPAAAINGSATVQDNGTDYISAINITTGGVITLTKQDFAAFTSSGNKGIRAGSIVYRVA